MMMHVARHPEQSVAKAEYSQAEQLRRLSDTWKISIAFLLDSYCHCATRLISIWEWAWLIADKNKGSNGLLRCSLACTLPQVLRRSRLTAGQCKLRRQLRHRSRQVQPGGSE